MYLSPNYVLSQQDGSHVLPNQFEVILCDGSAVWYFSMEVSHVCYFNSMDITCTRTSREIEDLLLDRESSLQIKISNNYSLFICLAILINHRTEILEQEMDFVNLSMVINSDGSHVFFLFECHFETSTTTAQHLCPVSSNLL